MDADGNYITEDMQEGLRRAKELIISLKATIDCEGIDISAEKGKVDIVELEELDTIKLIDEKSGELLLECKVSDKTIQFLLEVGLNTILERAIFEYESGGDFLGYDDLLKNPLEWDSNSPNMQEWENNLDKEWTSLTEEEE